MEKRFKKKHWIYIVIAIVLIIVIIGRINSIINKKNQYNVISDSYLKDDFINALNEIEADHTKISNIEKIDNWAGGERYRFIYDDKITLIVYCNAGSTVESINYNEEKIYCRGYESYNINHYVYKSSYILDLQMKAEEVVSLYLNYPLTAKFSYNSADWGVARYNNIYYLSSFVKASNAFGVYSIIDFKIAYNVIEENNSMKYKPIYLIMDGKNQFNYLNSYKSSEERKKVEPKNPYKYTMPASGINLIYGVLGDYGKEESIDGEKYIFYYIPAGKYIITNYGDSGAIFLDSNEMKKNSAGYLESVDSKMYTFESGSKGKTIQLEIPLNYHIEISMYTMVNFEIINS
ncbi:MAG: hypothetical protein IJY62_02485 [Clostridia bacterium]|nr:hypothetical protein [Clostridia bacterium]